MSLEYLFSPTKQFTYPSGKLLDGGKVYVYFKDTTDLATLYSPEGLFVSNPILLDANGRASVRADIEYQYRLEIYTNKDVLLYTCEAFCEGDGSGGFGFVIHDETLSGNGTASNPLGVINIPLAVEDSLTAYEDVVDGKNSLVLGVNSAWLDERIDQELAGKVDRTEFEDCCSAVNAALDNKLNSSAFDLSNYYNKQETNNLLDQRVDRYEFAQTMNWVDQTKQDKLTFGYDENSAISSINYSALAGGQGGDTTPWISGTKHIAETQLMTDNMLIQVLSSFDLSGNKNHCINVKGGMYRFPNQWEIASSIQNTNWFMEKSAMSGYFPTSSFNNFIDNGYNPTITTLYNSASNLINSASWLIYNKLDISAFSSWSANLVLSGDYYPMTGNPSGFLTEHQDLSYISGKIDNKLDTTALENLSGEFYPMTGNPSGFLTQHQDLSDYATTSIVNNISSYLSGQIDDKLDKSESGNYYPMTGNPSGFLTAHQSLEDYYKKTETSSKEQISAAIAAIPLGDVEVNNAVHNNSANWNNVTNKLDATAYHELTAGTNIDIQNYVISSKDWTNTITAASAYAYSQATAQIPAPFDPTYISGQIDNKLNNSDSAKFYPMTGNPSGFLTAHQSLTNYYTKTETSSKQQISAALQYISANAGKTYSGIDPIVVNNTTNQISADTWSFSAGNGVSFVDDNENKVTRIDVTGADLTDYYKKTETSSKQEISAALNNVSANFSNYYTKTETSSKQEISAALNNINTDIQYVSANAGKTYTGDDPIYVNNTTNHIGITGESLSAGPNIDIFSSGGYVVISATGGGGGGGSYTGISPIVVNNNTNQISAKGVSFGVQSPLFFVQDDNEAVIIGCSAGGGGGTTYTGDAQGALDEVYANSGVWLTAHQDISNLMPKSESANFYPMTGNPSGFLTAHQSLADYQTTADMVNYQTTASMTGYVTVSDYNNATARIAELEQVLQTYSGQWLLPNEGEE